MRRIFLFPVFFLLALCCSSPLHAQRFRAGFTAGPVVTDVQGADTRDFDVDMHKLGFTAGGIVNTVLDDQNSFQFEINYVTKGSMQPPDSANNGYYRLVLNYIEVPLVYRHRLEFKMNQKMHTHMEVEFGASAGRLVQFKELVNNYPQTFGSSSVNKTDISLLFGVNYVVSEHFYFGFRYANSVIPALKKNSIPIYFARYTFNNGNNMVLQLSMHYIFGKAAVPDNGDTQ